MNNARFFSLFRTPTFRRIPAAELPDNTAKTLQILGMIVRGAAITTATVAGTTTGFYVIFRVFHSTLETLQTIDKKITGTNLDEVLGITQHHD